MASLFLNALYRAMCAAGGALVLLLGGVVGATTPGIAAGAVRYVATTGVDSGFCAAAATPCRTLQYAVDRAVANDEVRIAAGEYAGVLDHAAPTGYIPATVRQVVYVDKTVTLRGGFTIASWTTPNPVANPTTINAQNGGRCVFLAGSGDPALNIHPVLEGLRFSGGNASGMRGVSTRDAGGGVYAFVAAATIRNCTFAGNTASSTTKGSGGGLAAFWADLTLANCTIENNTGSTAGSGDGGGAYVFGNSGGVAITGTTIRNNVAGTASAGGGGGGIYLSDSMGTFAGNTVEGNTAASGANVNGYGGGVYLDDCTLSLENNTIRGNRASADAVGGAGGGIYMVDGGVSLSGDQILDNTADARTIGGGGNGGGLAAASTIVGKTARLTMRNVTIARNLASAATTSSIGAQGGGAHLRNLNATISNCTIEDNKGSVGAFGDGGGLYLLDSAATIIGSVIARNAAGATMGRGGGIYVATPMQRSGAGLRLIGSTVEGNAAAGSDTGAGGGVMIERYSPTLLIGNRITGNVASASPGLGGSGGGVCLGEDLNQPNPVVATVPATIVGNVISGNKGSSAHTGNGGGIYASWASAGWGGLVVTLNRIEGNTAGLGGDGSGGGVRLYKSPFSRVDGNAVRANRAGGDGGGISARAGDHVTIESNTVQGNIGCTQCTYPGAGGIDLSGNWIEVRRNLVAGNSSSETPSTTSTGGGIAGFTGRSWAIVNNVIADNTAAAGSGMSLYGNIVPFPFAWDLLTSGVVGHNTVSNNRGGGAGINLSWTRGPATNLAAAVGAGATLVRVDTGLGWGWGIRSPWSRAATGRPRVGRRTGSRQSRAAPASSSTRRCSAALPPARW